MSKKIGLIIVVILVIGLVVFVASSYSRSTNNSTAETQDATTQEVAPVSSSDNLSQEQLPTNQSSSSTNSKGEYITYEEFSNNKDKYGNSTVVYFFNAKWCPTCQALTKNITANISDIPDNFVIVSIDYDKYTDLKKQYGVTIQHTLVQVDSAGNTIKKWSGGNTLESIVSKV